MNGTFNSDRIKDYTKDLLLRKLTEVSGPKDLVIDTQLMRPLDRIVEPSALKNTGVDRILKLEKPVGPIKGSPKRVYIVSNQPGVVRGVCAQVNIDFETGVVCQYHLFLVPRLTHVCEAVLETEGVHGHVTTSKLPFLLVPLDRHLLSMENKLFYRSLFLDGDQSVLHDVASALLLLQQLYGPFHSSFLIGSAAQKSEELMRFMQDRHSNPPINHSHTTQAIIIDRNLDLVTPLCTQVTYEGLLDEMFPVDCGFMTLGKEVTNLQNPTKILLSSQDLIFQEIRDRHFSNVSTFLSAKAKELQLEYERSKGLNIAGTKDFIRNDLKSLMNQHNKLSTHVGACDYITKVKTRGEIVKQLQVEHNLLDGTEVKGCIVHIEELINKQADLHTSLSLLCLLSLTQAGLSTSLHNTLLTLFLQSYGYEHLAGINSLWKGGLLLRRPISSSSSSSFLNKVIQPQQHSFRSIAKKLNLIPKSASDVNLKNPDDISYVLGGALCPLLCRLVEQVMSGSDVLEETMKSLDIPFSCNKYPTSARATTTAPQPLVIVVFLGGISHCEIAALKLLGKMKGCHVVICTSSIINNKSFLKPLFN